ncbi:hypothetical protein [Porphyromonas miyakawae]
MDELGSQRLLSLFKFRTYAVMRGGAMTGKQKCNALTQEAKDSGLDFSG